MALDSCLRNLASARFHSTVADTSGADESDLSDWEEFEDDDLNDLLRLLAEAEI